MIPSSLSGPRWDFLVLIRTSLDLKPETEMRGSSNLNWFYWPGSFQPWIKSHYWSKAVSGLIQYAVEPGQNHVSSSSLGNFSLWANFHKFHWIENEYFVFNVWNCAHKTWNELHILLFDPGWLQVAGCRLPVAGCVSPSVQEEIRCSCQSPEHDYETKINQIHSVCFAAVLV